MELDLLMGLLSVWSGPKSGKLQSSEWKEPQWKKCPHEIQLQGNFSISNQCGRFQLMVVGTMSVLVVLSSIYKAGWASQGKWVSKENSSMASESTSASMFQPCLSFCSGFLQWCSIFWRHKLNKLSSPQLVFGGSISLQHEKPEHYNTKLCSHCYFPLPLRTLEYLLKGRR